jgi:hypothetical protein
MDSPVSSEHTAGWRLDLEEGGMSFRSYPLRLSLLRSLLLALSLSTAFFDGRSAGFALAQNGKANNRCADAVLVRAPEPEPLPLAPENESEPD